MPTALPTSSRPPQAMTAQTLANNAAAADKTKPPATKTGSQPWYHWFWW